MVVEQQDRFEQFFDDWTQRTSRSTGRNQQNIKDEVASDIKATMADSRGRQQLIRLLGSRGVDVLQGLTAENKTTEAVALISNSHRRSYVSPRRAEKTERRHERKVKGRYAAGDRVMVVQEMPRVFQSGAVAHRFIEEVRVNRATGLGKGVYLPHDKAQQDFVDRLWVEREDIISQAELDGFKASRKKSGASKRLVEMHLSVPLPAFDEGVNLEEWALKNLKDAWEKLETSIEGEFPVTPREVTRLRKDPMVAKSIDEVVECVAILGGVNNGDLGWLDVQPEKVVVRKIDTFETLNVLACGREVLRINREVKVSEKNGQEVLVSELRVGMAEVDGIILKVGVCDLVELFWDGGPPRSRHAAEDFPSVVASCVGRARSQAKEFRRTRIDEVSGREVVYQTRKPRSFEQLLWDLYGHYGEEVFEKLKITIIDEKFVSGDGDARTVLDVWRLPVASHKRQVHDYLFGMAAVMCAVEKSVMEAKEIVGRPRVIGLDMFENEIIEEHSVSNGNSRKLLGVTRQEVLEYVQKRDLAQRLTARLEYQTPRKWEPFTQSLPFGVDLENWGSELASEARKAEERIAGPLVLATLRLISKHRLESMPVVHEEPRKLPSNLLPICDQEQGANYLVIEDLREIVLQGRTEAGRQVLVERSAHFENEGVYVLWLRGLSDDGVLYRVAVNRRSGKFLIRGVREWEKPLKNRQKKPLGRFLMSSLIGGEEGESYNTSGFLVKERKAVGVGVDRQGMVKEFEQRIWEWLSGSVSPRVVSGDTGELIGPNGQIVPNPLDKPILLSVDPMAGRFVLDMEAIHALVESRKINRHDNFRIRDSLAMLQAKRLNMFCPHPLHDNYDTPAVMVSWHSGLASCANENCGVVIVLPDRAKRAEGGIPIPRRAPESVSDYELLGRSRERAIATFVRIAEICGKHDLTAREYLADARGINPANIRHGYIPKGLGEALFSLGLREEFWAELREIEGKDPTLAKKMPGMNIRELESLLQSDQARRAVSKVNDALDFLKSGDNTGDYRVIVRALNYVALKAMHANGILPRSRLGEKEEDEIGREERLSGRVITPTFWVKRLKGGLAIAPSNFYGRGIEFATGEKLFGTPKHYKAPVGKGRWKEDGQFQYATPAGIWVIDPDKFWQNAKLRQEVVIFEGQLNGASFAQINPEYRDVVLATGGTKVKSPVALLLKEMRVKRFYLGMDWGTAGRVALENFANLISEMQPGAEIKMVEDLLPKDLVRMIDPDSGVEDMNDLIMKTAPGARYKFVTI